MATPQPRPFGELLRRYRMAAGLTQEELAERAGLSRRAIGALETGDRRTPHKETIALLAEALGLTAAEQSLLESAARPGTGRATSTAPGSARGAAGLRQPSQPLVGRQNEMRAVEKHLAGDGPPLLVLTGEAGIGKSRLLYEAMRLASDQGWTVLSGGCHRRSGQEPYAPVVAMLTHFLASRTPMQQRLDLQGCAWLVRLLPELAEQVIRPAPSWRLSPGQERRLLFGAVGRLLTNVSGSAGTLVVLDDLHWAGDEFLDLLAALLQEREVGALRIIAAYRDTDVAARDPLPLLVSDLARDNLAERIGLLPLDREEARTLLTELLASQAGTNGDQADQQTSQPALIDVALERSGGLPLFLVSWSQEIRAGSLSADVVGTAVPWSAAESISQRVIVLSDVTRDVLAVAAVAGRQFSRSVLLAASITVGQDEQSILAGLDAAVRARLIAETADGSYVFTHDLIRETIMRHLGSARQASLHRRVAAALEAQPHQDRRAAELAWHLAEGDEPARALPYALEAGAQAKTVYAHTEAERHYRMAVGLARTCGDSSSQAQALEQLADVLWGTGNFQEMPALLDAAAEIHRQAGNLDQYAWDVAQETRPFAVLGQSDIAFARLRQLLASLTEPGITGSSETSAESTEEPNSTEAAEPEAHPDAQSAPPDLPPHPLESVAARAVTHLSARSAGRVYSGIAICLSYQRNYLQAIPFGELAVRYTELAGERWLEVRSRMFLANALLNVGRSAQARAVIVAGYQIAQATGDMEGVSLLAGSLGDLLTDSGALAEGARAYEQALGAAQSYGGPDVLAQIHCGLARIALFQGKWEEALSSCQRAREVMAAYGFGSYSADVALLQGVVSLYRGEHQQAHVYLDQAIQNSTSQSGANANDPALVLLQADTALSETDLLRDGAAAAQARLEPWLERSGPHERNSTTLLPLLAWVWSDRGEVERAEALLARYLEQPREQHFDLVFVDALRIQAMLALRRARWDEAQRALDEAISRCRAMPYPYAEAKALFVYGQFHAARGEHAQAAESYQAALAMLNQLGERLYAEQVGRALRELAGG